MEVFMNDREFSDIQIFQHSGQGIPLFMFGHKSCLQADYLLGPGSIRLKKKKKNLPGRGLTKVEKHCSRVPALILPSQRLFYGFPSLISEILFINCDLFIEWQKHLAQKQRHHFLQIFAVLNSVRHSFRKLFLVILFSWQI
jgi:hypothetical protein